MCSRSLIFLLKHFSQILVFLSSQLPWMSAFTSIIKLPSWANIEKKSYFCSQIELLRIQAAKIAHYGFEKKVVQCLQSGLISHPLNTLVRIKLVCEVSTKAWILNLAELPTCTSVYTETRGIKAAADWLSPVCQKLGVRLWIVFYLSLCFLAGCYWW